jgi:MFS transporter, OFA family, oxalate/formate antiporter
MTAAPGSGRRTVGEKVAIVRASLSYRGWRIVLAGFFMFLLAFGAPLTMPFVYPEVMREFGWTLTQATLIYTYKSLTGAVVAIFIIGPLVDRIGLKPVLVGAMIAEAVGLASFLFVHSLWSYYLVGFLIGTGQGAVLICIRLLVSRWFMRNIGLATGIAIMGASCSGLVFPLVISQLLPLYGWRIAFSCLSLAIFLVSIPIALACRTNPREEDVIQEAVRMPNRDSVERLRSAELDSTLGAFLRQPTFWMIAIATFLSAAVDQALFQHSIFFLTNEVGLSRTVAASAWSGTFLIAMFVKFLAGWVYDRHSVKGVAFWNLLLAAAILLALPVHGFLTALVYTSVLGFARGGLSVDGPVIAKHVYGPRFLNRFLPIFAGFNTLGSATGPVALAMLYDGTGSYRTGFAVFFAIVIVSAFLLWRVRPFYRDRLRVMAPEAL